MNNYQKFLLYYATYVTVIHLIPGPWRHWTSAGKAIDTWTLTHLTWGGIAKYYNIPLWSLLGLSVSNELAELYLRRIKFLGIWGEPETPSNVSVDLLTTALGWWLTSFVINSRQLKLKVSET